MFNGKMQVKSSLLLGLGLAASFGAQASIYTGLSLGYSQAEFTHPSETTATEASPWLTQVQVGYFFNDYLAIEGRLGTSMMRNDDLAVDTLASAYLKANVPVSNQVAVYGLLGASSVTMNQKDKGSETETSGSFGVGVHYALDKNKAVTVEFVDSLTKDEMRLASFNLGFQYRF